MDPLDNLVFCLFSPDGTLSDLQRLQAGMYHEAGYALVLAVNTPARIAADGPCG
ncbi:hypothetical protein HMH01_16240 [Halovulum dunhuangense]|uniref:Uncharacterized protein n=1 Tax=Halovulum dunhuangense TaxID=1505036 RepID=A0A849L660_9RHOB|nr:hypothetical protein [Halovulum dunhuangense]NNU81988.1 hypothetical protein [Halovulum dunhuangense]